MGYARSTKDTKPVDHDGCYAPITMVTKACQLAIRGATNPLRGRARHVRLHEASMSLARLVTVARAMHEACAAGIRRESYLWRTLDCRFRELRGCGEAASCLSCCALRGPAQPARGSRSLEKERADREVRHFVALDPGGLTALIPVP